MSSKKTEGMKAPVSKRAVVARVQRRVAKCPEPCGACDGEEQALVFRKVRHKGDKKKGEWCVIDRRGSEVSKWVVDLDEFARKLGVLHPYEVMVDGDEQA